MKNFTKTSLLIVLLAFAFGGCAPKTSKTIVNNTGGGTGTNPITDTDGDGIPDSETGSESIEGCDGVPRTGATRCYVASLPTLSISGPGTVGPIYWSSATGNLGGTDPNEFQSDRVFSVRVKAVKILGGTSLSGRACSPHTSGLWGKLKVDVMLRKTASLGQTLSFEADTNVKDGYSAKKYFTVPGGSSNLVLEITQVLSDHSCSSPSGAKTCPYAAIFTQTNTPYSDCVGVKLEFSTDSTYDLPKN